MEENTAYSALNPRQAGMDHTLLIGQIQSRKQLIHFALPEFFFTGILSGTFHPAVKRKKIIAGNS